MKLGMGSALLVIGLAGCGFVDTTSDESEAVGVTTLPSDDDPRNRVRSDLRYAIPLVQGITATKEPRAFDREDDAAFGVPILSPHQIMGEECSGTEAPDCSGGTLWYEIAQPSGNGRGWVEAKLVEVWNNRHALMPTKPGAVPAGWSVRAYCDRKTTDDAIAGRAYDPCLTFTPAMLARAGDRLPFPVLEVLEGEDPEGRRMNFFRVLVSTHYSNISPIDAQGQSGGVSDLAFANTNEFMLLIDATGSMETELDATAQAFRNVFAELEQMPEIGARFAVVAYRDSKGERDACPRVEGTTDQEGELGFVGADEASDFLASLTACGGADKEEAIWDALEIIKELEVTRGATRWLVLAGDAPAVGTTRGGTWLGVEVQEGLKPHEVMANVSATIGHSTSAMGFLVADDIRGPVELMQRHLKLANAPSFVRFEKENLDSMAKEVTQALTGKLQVARRSLEQARTCEEAVMREDYAAGGASLPVFCGDAADPELAARIADLVAGPEDLVVREVWIQEDKALFDVALLTREESRRTADALGQLATRAAEDNYQGCRKMGSEAWYAVLDAIIPGETLASDEGSVLSRPPVSRALHEYWGLRAHGGQSILKFNAAQLDELDPEGCRDLADRLSDSQASITKARDDYKGNAFVWLPFSRLP